MVKRNENNDAPNKKLVDVLGDNNRELEYLMEATEAAIILLDEACCVQQFTEGSTDVFNLTPSDIGRPLKEVSHLLDYPNIIEDIKYVLESSENVKRVVCNKDDRWIIVRIHPCPAKADSEITKGAALILTKFPNSAEMNEINIEHKFHKTLAILGLYALEQSDIQTVLKRAIDLGCLNLKLDCAVIYALNVDDNTFSISAQAGCAKKDKPLKLDEKWDAGFALQNIDTPTIVTDYQKEKRFFISPYLEHRDVVSSIHIAVRGTEDTYGLLGFYSYEKRKFTDNEVHFVQAVANIVGMAIQQDRAKQELKNETERSLQYQREIVNNSIIDRWEVGGYLHDQLGQSLAVTKILINDIKSKLAEGEKDIISEVEQVKSIIDENIEGIRDLTHYIIPVDIEKEGVEYAFRFLMRQTQKLYGINCTLKIGDIISEIKDRKVATQLYYIIQEGIKNAATHGQAQNIKVEIFAPNGEVVLRVEDDGTGFPSAKKCDEGRGLRIVKYRMELLCGNIDIKNKAEFGNGTGTIMTCTIPLKLLS